MTLFEYLTIAFALLYSVAALRLIGGLSVAASADRRYWPHLLLLGTWLLVIAGTFWTFWSLREVAWTFPGFMVAMLVIGALYYCSVVLVPEDASTITSWRVHYYSAHRRWYGGLSAWAVAIALNASVNLGFPILHPSRGIQLFVLSVGVIGVVSASPRVHAALSVVLATIVVGAFWIIALTPDWLVQL
jgi:hypothetical protein